MSPRVLRSHSKPLNYAIALNELGSEVVHGYVGTEPTGGKFNALELDYRSELALCVLYVYTFDELKNRFGF